ncbi:histidine phosphatase family protein KNAG_0J02220 [Huiozyma naganishii CBS 8797]|uniref:Phosphoglycerate mutase-like protein n=1 Tax=Huiozyma naganishii (strain ATCC MYA-139 / BCRC 22969 / CBS 8797 / KCTC 17520 / NBRC 10181 / NCYC 3082 / Yp74L-3) TaxID=1071383 RepID=J7RR31_HUIN7|nr:hypothetical protein KNAG_0J02220 [Kazachstania naganishii CBS 8797]CCK72303.1 hypothetical protein KNAG_0J02220 [Kazachstania naganishii CBS 8797]
MTVNNKPKLIVLIRHGTSEWNENEEVITKVPAHLIGLTEVGREQSILSGLALLKTLNLDGVDSVAQGYHFKKVEDQSLSGLVTQRTGYDPQKLDKLNLTVYISPFKCARETSKGVLDVIEKYNFLKQGVCNGDTSPAEVSFNPCKKRKHAVWSHDVVQGESEITRFIDLKVREDPRLREQDFGNFKDIQTMKDVMSLRSHYGEFFFRFLQGESAADVFNRVANFHDSMFRTFRTNAESGDGDWNDVFVIITHDIFLRVFLMRWFRWTYEEFETIAKLPNGCLIVMELDEATDTYILKTEIPKTQKHHSHL